MRKYIFELILQSWIMYLILDLVAVSNPVTSNIRVKADGLNSDTDGAWVSMDY